MAQPVQTFILGVSGSIAAYKSPLVLRAIHKAGMDVHVVMSPSATEFVTPLVLANLSRHAVAVNMFDENVQRGGSWHIDLARAAHAMLIAPASAKTIASLAHGITDTPVSCVALALPESVPLFIAPAMDTEMWEHPVTQHNVNILRSRGVHVLWPVTGELASGSVGMGRMQEPDDIVASVLRTLRGSTRAATSDDPITEAAERTSSPLQDALDHDAWSAEFMLSVLKGSAPDARPLSGRTVLITAGPTRERIDDVRFLSNYSSGKMGFAMAEEAAAQGARVILVSGPVDLPTPANVERTDVESAEQMRDVVMRHASHYDVAILAAAVADFAPAKAVNGKIKKEDVGASPVIDLVRTPDVLASLGAVKKDGQFLVGFALESVNGLENGRKKLLAKNCDMVVVNSAASEQPAMGGDTNEIAILRRTSDSPISVPRSSKRDCARIILAAITAASSPTDITA